VAEKDDISMPELARELQAASGVKADPASLSRWLIRNGLTFKKNVWPAPFARGFFEIGG
jgi:transposase